jgi:hydrogenase maturation protease
MSEPLLVAGVGNVFFGDDGFGVEVSRRLSAEPLPPGVEVADFGIRGLHLAYRLLEPLRALVIVDAVPRGGPAGTLYVLEPDADGDPEEAPDAHGMSLPAVFAAVRALGGALPRTRIVGCEPASVEERMGLSAAVEAAVRPAMRIVREVLEREVTSAAPGAAREAER